MASAYYIMYKEPATRLQPAHTASAVWVVQTRREIRPSRLPPGHGGASAVACCEQRPSRWARGQPEQQPPEASLAPAPMCSRTLPASVSRLGVSSTYKEGRSRRRIRDPTVHSRCRHVKQVTGSSCATIPRGANAPQSAALPYEDVSTMRYFL